MPQEARELICMITRGTDHELSSVGFTIANGGITAGLKVFIFLSSSGVDLVRKRAADTTQVNPLEPQTNQRFYGTRRNHLGLHSVRQEPRLR